MRVIGKSKSEYLLLMKRGRRGKRKERKESKRHNLAANTLRRRERGPIGGNKPRLVQANTL